VKEPKVRKQRKTDTQVTPQGTEIPVPKRSDYLRDLRKVSEPKAERKPEG
jgi:hypothetical protein